MVTGSCLCGDVAFEVDAFAAPAVNCHCMKCRKAHGAPFTTTAPVRREHFRWTRGEEALRHFESSPGKLRHFCGRCGSHLMAEWVDQPGVAVRFGPLDDDPGAKPTAHIWCDESAPWFDPGAELPSRPAGRDS